MRGAIEGRAAGGREGKLLLFDLHSLSLPEEEGWYGEMMEKRMAVI